VEIRPISFSLAHRLTHLVFGELSRALHGSALSR
jgi:hypothetical protein